MFSGFTILLLNLMTHTLTLIAFAIRYRDDNPDQCTNRLTS